MRQGIQQLKDQGYAARFIFLAPPDIPTLEQRLQRRGSDEAEKIKQRLEIAQQEIEQSKSTGFHDKIIVNDDLEKSYKALEDYVFGREESNEAAVVEEVITNGETVVDAHIPEGASEDTATVVTENTTE